MFSFNVCQPFQQQLLLTGTVDAQTIIKFGRNQTKFAKAITDVAEIKLLG